MVQLLRSDSDINLMRKTSVWGRGVRTSCLFFLFIFQVFAEVKILPSTNLHPCSYLFETLTEARDISKIEKIKILALNHENLFDWKIVRQAEKKEDEAKPEWERVALGNYTKASDPDVIVGTEIDSVSTGEAYQKAYLGDRYRVIGIEGNDERGIDIVLFVKKDLPFDIEFESHKEDQYSIVGTPGTKKLFSRDAPVLIFWPTGVPKTGSPQFIVIGEHLKSQRPTKAGLSDSEIRGLQMKRSVEVVSELETRFGKDTLIIVAGDMNENLDTGPNASTAFEGSLQDAADVAANPNKGKQGTHVYFRSNDSAADISRLDGFKVNSAAIPYVKDFKTLPFVGKEGPTDTPPVSYHDRELNYGSDHRGIQMEIDFKKLFEDRRKKK
jgi:hypothetical protein